MSPRLSLATLYAAREGVARPGFDPAAHGVGQVHLGLGAFHRAHQAVYSDAALGASGGDWRIAGVSLRSSAPAEALGPQDGLYTLIERGPDGTTVRVVGSLARVIAEARTPGATLAAMTAPATRVVSLTVTEKAYGIDRTTHRVIADHSAVAPDLAEPRRPRGALGLIAEALRLRRQAGAPPLTVLCCDNLPENGALLRAGVVDFARRTDAALGDWIAAEVAFPSTMVDRITPAATAATFAEAERLTGLQDAAAVETEPFSQWVIEDRFPAGRPDWEAGGAILIAEVAPYERMKLRMLNGAHSMLAYAGSMAGHRYVRDAMTDPVLALLVRRHLAAAAATLDPLPGVDLDAYAAALTARFANPAIAHETRQIAMDGTEKLPQRLLAPASEVLAKGGDLAPFAFAVAAWMRYATGRTEDGGRFTPDDPRAAEIAAALDGARSPDEIVAALQSLPGLFSPALAASETWRETLAARLAAMLERGMRAAIDAEQEVSGS